MSIEQYEMFKASRIEKFVDFTAGKLVSDCPNVSKETYTKFLEKLTWKTIEYVDALSNWADSKDPMFVFENMVSVAILIQLSAANLKVDPQEIVDVVNYLSREGVFKNRFIAKKKGKSNAKV